MKITNVFCLLHVESAFQAFACMKTTKLKYQRRSPVADLQTKGPLNPNQIESLLQGPYNLTPLPTSPSVVNWPLASKQGTKKNGKIIVGTSPGLGLGSSNSADNEVIQTEGFHKQEMNIIHPEYIILIVGTSISMPN